MLKLCKKLWLPLHLAILLMGCGFTPQAINSLPPQLRQVYYQPEHPYEPLEMCFKKRLKAAGTKLLAASQPTSPIISITSNYSATTNNPASSTQARTYTLNYTATITLSDFNQQQLLPAKTANVSRNITLQPDEVFESTPQVAIIKQELQQELVTKIFNILSAPKTFQALKNRHEN